MIRTLRMGAVGLAAIVFGLGFALQAAWLGVGLSVLLGGLWLSGQLRGIRWSANWGLAGSVALAAWGAWLDLPAALLLLGTLLALAGWDLDHFAQRLARVEDIVGEAAITREHMRRLLFVLAAGLLLGGLALLLRTSLGFGWALLAGALAILGLRGLLGASRRLDDVTLDKPR